MYIINKMYQLSLWTSGRKLYIMQTMEILSYKIFFSLMICYSIMIMRKVCICILHIWVSHFH